MTNRDPDPLAVWSEESSLDRRNTRWAVLAAVVVHALFFLLQLPETVAAVHEPTRRPVFVVQETRFKPPPPRQLETIPERRVLRVPIPDPTPDDPEPLVPTAKVAVPVALLDTDLVLGVPLTPPPPERPAGPLRVGGDVRPPVRLHSPPPRYTEIARLARIEGRVILEAVIDADGSVTRLRLVQGLGFGLDEAALEAVRQWRFAPGTHRGKPVAVLYVLTIHFNLE